VKAGPPPLTRKKLTILIVDDEPGTLDALSAVLEDAEYRVETASNGRIALEKIAAEDPPIDAVLLDYLMPVLDGAETLQALRKDGQAMLLPVVFMSGIQESMIRRRAKNYDAFLRKPFGLDELLACVKKIVKPKSKTTTTTKKKKRTLAR
jgi:CheY-like chemotaxis protein